MTQSIASNQITVDYSYDKWRLIQMDNNDPKLIAEATPETGLRYNKYFATTRFLPPTGAISAQDISQVILGWSYETDAWQLGITLSPQLASARNSRWCELVRWSDPDISIYEDEAKAAGQALADVLEIPFRDVPPSSPPKPAPAPLPDLPLSVGIWTLDRVMTSEGLTSRDGELHLVRSQSYVNGKLGRIGWYTLWAVIYTVISIATLTSNLALPNAGTLLPNPQVLPYLGLVAALLLVGMIIQQIMQLLNEPDNIIISPYERSITGRRGRNIRWKVNANNIQSVYASEIVKKREAKPVVYHSELNLHLINGKFQRILVEDEKISNANIDNDFLIKKNRAEGVTPLDTHEITTRLQAFALYVAECLGDLPAWHDLRFK